jgi:hypothetical protein
MRKARYHRYIGLGQLSLLKLVTTMYPEEA